MTSRESVRSFIEQKCIAVAGVSLTSEKFGNAILKELPKKGYSVFGINPKADAGDGTEIYPDFESLPEKPSAVIVTVKPDESENVVKSAHAAGINHVWFQQGAQSDAALAYCSDNGLNFISNECIFMFAEPVDSIHKFHRFIWKVLGKLPK